MAPEQRRVHQGPETGLLSRGAACLALPTHSMHRQRLLLHKGAPQSDCRRKNEAGFCRREGGMWAGEKGGGRRDTQHSHVDPRGRAIPKQQVARWEVSDPELAHHIALRVQDPAHCYALVLGQVQSHLWKQTDMLRGAGPATGQREPWAGTIQTLSLLGSGRVCQQSPATNHNYPTGDKSHMLPRTGALELCTPHALNFLGQSNLIQFSFQ